jgi:hypothetical protein
VPVRPRTGPASTAVLPLIGAVLALVLVICGCSSSPPKAKPTTSSTATTAGNRFDQLTVALVACFYQHHLIPHGSQGGGEPLPVKDDRLETSGGLAQGAIMNWYNDNGQNVLVNGKSIGNWDSAAQNSGQWPTSLCGPIPSASS